MKNPLAPIRRQDGQRRFASENLKRCPLCGAVNARQNYDCFQCTWSGHFDYDIEIVEEGLEELLMRCPELAELLLTEPTAWQRFKTRISNLFTRFSRRRRIDIWA